MAAVRSLPCPLRGVVPPMVTPLRDRRNLDVAGLERLVEHLLAGGVGGLFVLGTTGEAPSLSHRLRRELVARTCGLVGGRVPVLVGITDTSFEEAVDLAGHAADAGADAVVNSVPYYLPPGQPELLGIKCGLSVLGICDDFMAEPFHRFRDPERDQVRVLLAELGVLSMNLPAATPVARWEPYVLTPRSHSLAPVAVAETHGQVEGAAGLLDRGTAGALCLRFPPGGQKPFVVFDFGASSVGGYAVFRVRSHTGTPTVRLAFSCFRGACGERGDFERGSCTYLGVELPVLPANPGRFELYTIPRDGEFIAPLLQGQLRWARVQLDTEGTEVEIEQLRIENHKVHDLSPLAGHFLCDDERLNWAWYASVWTLQLASFPNHNAWTALHGWLIPRRLEKGADIGLSRGGAEWRDYTLEFDLEIRRNPYAVSAAGWVVRARDEANGYVGSLDLESVFRLRRLRDGACVTLKEVRLDTAILDGERHHVRVELSGDRIVTALDGRVIDTTTDATFAAGRVGLCQPKEAWALVANLRVTAPDGRVLLRDDFTGDLEAWEFARTLSFVADGAKRDRLIWSGDLDWAGRNVYYGFREAPYMRDSIRMLAANQTPDGYVQACPYPENQVPPAADEYGPFPSDEFSAWFVPVAWDYLLFTGDAATLREVYGAVTRCLADLLRYVGDDGLFHQRPATSKHAENLDLGDVGTRSYMNLLVHDALAKGARIARELGHEADAARFDARAAALAEATNRSLWVADSGWFALSLEDRRLGHTAGALALATGFASPAQAAALVPQLGYHGHGKFQSLQVRGKFQAGYGEQAMTDFFAHNWAKIGGQADVPWTVTECMHVPRGGWGDESHPDTAVAHLFSGYVLGVQPTAPGYREYAVRPHVVGPLTRAEGLVPTPRGDIAAAWRLDGPLLTQTVALPPGPGATLGVPCRGLARYRVTVDGTVVREADGSLAVPPNVGRLEATADWLLLREVTPGPHTLVTEALAGSFRGRSAEAAAVASPSGQG